MDLPKLLDLKMGWLNPVPAVSVYDVAASGVGLGGGAMHFSFAPLAGGEAGAKGTTVLLKIDSLQAEAHAKVSYDTSLSRTRGGPRHGLHSRPRHCYVMTRN